MQTENLIIIGAGPAGLTAALYAARADLAPLVLGGTMPGGKISLTEAVENFPGFDSILGTELADKLQAQAEKFGARVEMTEVTAVDFTRGSPFTLYAFNTEYRARAVIVTTGASARQLGIPGETELTGRGVSYCATCDGYFFRNKEVIVVGGGDSAVQEAIFLTKFARRVRIVHRRNILRASEVLQARARAHPKIEFIYDTVLEAIEGRDKVEAVRARNVQTGQTERVATDGVFIFIGHLPNTRLFGGQLQLDDQGFVVVDRHMQTSVAGVFAAGEVMDPLYKQAISSAGQGCQAALSAERYLEYLP